MDTIWAIPTNSSYIVYVHSMFQLLYVNNNFQMKKFDVSVFVTQAGIQQMPT